MVSLIADHGIHQMLRRQRGLTELLMDSDEVVAVSNLQALWNTSWIGTLPTHLHKRRTVAVAASEAFSVGCNSGAETVMPFMYSIRLLALRQLHSEPLMPDQAASRALLQVSSADTGSRRRVLLLHQ
jgi:hypothetical protein